MNEFLEKWRSDKKYRAKIKLLLYTIFVIVVSVYALSLDRHTGDDTINDLSDLIKTETKEENVITLPEEYNYKINITINDKNYSYYGSQNKQRRYITKEKEDTVTNYIYENNEYYIEDSLKIDNYIKTTREEVYDIINYNYINIDSINKYLSKATKEGNIYKVYLKDVILGNDSNNYFTITVDNNNIFIDYKALMQEFSIEEFYTYSINYQYSVKE